MQKWSQSNKAILFTLMTILLVSTLLGLVTILNNHEKNVSASLSSNLQAERITHLVSDIENGMENLNRINYSAIGNKSIISNLTFHDLNNSDYLTFMDQFSDMINIDFNLSLYPGFIIDGVNFTVNTSHIVLSSLQNISSISIEAYMPQINSTSSPSPTGSNLNLRAIFRDNTGVKLNNAVNLDKSLSNKQFSSVYSGAGIYINASLNKLVIYTNSTSIINQLNITFQSIPVALAGHISISGSDSITLSTPLLVT